MVNTKRVKYIGVEVIDLPSLGRQVSPGDVIEVGDDFANAAFEVVVPVKKSTKEER